MYVLDENRKPVPIGVPGEMYVSGAGVARGYLNRPELTAERFMEDPFEPGARMYRSGDLARWSPEGELEYLGRIDDQVKIRGHRIELGEIEASLLKHPSVREVVLTAQQEENEEAELVAYVVPEEDEWDLQECRSHLADLLPGYMLPSHFISLKSIPLTSNGKVDRKALPKPSEISGSSRPKGKSRMYKGPENRTEERLLQLFKEVLGVSDMGCTDNFFEWGGHSLKATV